MSKYLTAWKNEATGEIMSPKGLLVWPTLLEPRGNKKYPANAPKFSCGLLIPKAANVDLIKSELYRVAEEKYGKDFRKKKVDYPLLKTTEQEKLAAFAGDYPYFLKTSASKDFAPFVVGPNAKPFEGDASDIYSGRSGIIAGGAWPWGQNVGVGWNLSRVQLLDHGEALPVGGGSIRTVEGFESVDVGASGGETAKTADDVFGDDLGGL